jgi:tRNA(fMet)-specific endonuclease VapC
MKYMLDISVCVELLRGQVEKLRLLPASECVLSVITAAELEVGIRRSTRPTAQRRAVEAFTELFKVHPWDQETTIHYGEISVDLENQGIVIGPLELLIAAHARRLGATLVTTKAQELKCIAGLMCSEWE